MQINNINEIKDLFDFIEECSSDPSNMVFRGVKKKSYELVPSIGRLKTDKDKNFTVNDEKILLKLFKQKAYPYVEKHINNDLELLSIAQHHGLPTRLLDWSRNPLVALFFAVQSEFGTNELKEDSAIYIYHPKEKVTLDDEFDPFSVKDIKRYIPRYWSPRINAQSGLFTVHGNPMKPYRSDEITTLLVSENIRKEIKKRLNRFGIHQAILFPDLDGISQHITNKDRL